MSRKNQNAGERRECGTGPGAQAPHAYFPPPLGRPKYTRRNTKRAA
jgi:hypothetical protein